jgi:integrase
MALMATLSLLESADSRHPLLPMIAAPDDRGALDQHDRCGRDQDARVAQSARALRHTLATRLLRNRPADLTVVADVRGHATSGLRAGTRL